MRTKYLIITLLLAMSWLGANGQRFFNLTADDVRIDSVLPYFTYSTELGNGFADSVYTAHVLYPEYIDMTPADIQAYQRITDAPLPTTPEVETRMVVERKKGKLEVILMPLVMHEGKPRILVSFMLDIRSTPTSSPYRQKGVPAKASANSSRYAAHSVLATGKWAKIRVPSTGVYQITDALIRQAGFSDLNRVKVYGYGGALQNEKLVGAKLQELDDLQEVTTYQAGGRKLFHAQGPVTWDGSILANIVTETGTATTQSLNSVRVRNPYSDYGYYFITEGDETPLTTDSASFVNAFYPSAEDYNTLYENDGFAWFHGGRNLYDSQPILSLASRELTIPAKGNSSTGRLIVVISAGGQTQVNLNFNGNDLGDMYTGALYDYEFGKLSTKAFEVNNLQASNTLTLTNKGTAPVRVDFIQITSTEAASAPQLSASFPTAEYVYNITNQDLHGDGSADMVIIIPTSQKLRTQAERLKKYREDNNGLRVRIVPADELFNEFSSGTPDANAYRRYLKMLYDRAETENDMPKYLLLFGDAAWDNRMLSSAWSNYSPDDFLLAFESENSFSQIKCYVDDSWYGLLDDGEGTNPITSDKPDVAVGRFPVRTEEDAKTMVDKTIAYGDNKEAGAWQNTIMFMADDGNGNLHMGDANEIATDVAKQAPGYLIKKVMWDAYTMETSSTGNSYPEASRIIKEQQANGALIMDYVGHGNETSISHERVLTISDFMNFQNSRLPLWITASCDIMPFDASNTSIGEVAVLNKKGGAVAFLGTTRTVYASYNRPMNKAFVKYLLTIQNGKRTSIGEAMRLAKNELISRSSDLSENKLHFAVLGDPSLELNLPTMQVVIDSINNEPVSDQNIAKLQAGSTAVIKGHIEELGTPQTNFNGMVYATVRDSEETIVCKRNDPDMKKPTSSISTFTFQDRTKVLFNGSDSIRNGEFTFTFVVPMDINYTDASGMVNIMAINNDKKSMGHGANSQFTIGGSGEVNNDSIGPSIYCYLNSPSFVNGGDVNTTPYFVANITDKDGINASGSGIGHNMELIIDGDMSKTYVLNDRFSFDFGSYTTGSTSFNIPELSEGAHHLKFRAWDVLNNSSTAELTFNVVKGLEPNLFSVSTTNNPAVTNTTFIINHDRTGNLMDVEIEIFDMGGRHIWTHQESGVPTDFAYTVDWDLTVSGGSKLQTGIYLYRVKIGTDGSSKASKAKKLIILDNK
ncbi:MAG: type IX secretion system sortase PorU [Prevotella sp.]|nr:type IX secretion system sortase PorU [Prevotella sp.]